MLKDQISSLTKQMATVSNSVAKTEEQLRLLALEQRIDDVVKHITVFQSMKRNLDMQADVEILERLKNELLGTAY